MPQSTVTSVPGPRTPVQAPLSGVQNPLRVLRENLNLTQKSLGLQFKLSPYVILMAEQGVYNEPPPRLLSALVSLSHGLDVPTVREAYEEFQNAVRRSNYGKLKPDFRFDLQVSPTEHPLIEWRLQSGITSRVAISKLYCVHPSLINRFETTPNRCATVPGELQTALRISGYSGENLEAFSAAYGQFYRNLSSHVSYQGK